jgi:uncharacterized protein YbaR (Trm112 family)
VFFELTDLLTCPHCGPQHGLVLLVLESEGRRVLRGWLGCPGCRRDFPVTDGVADLRLTAEEPVGEPPPLEEDELALKIVALSGLAEEPGYLLLHGRLTQAAAEVSDLAHQLEIIALGPAPAEVGERPGVSRVLTDGPFPLVEGRLRCVAVAPGGDRGLVAEAARRVAAGGRLLLFDAREEDIDEARRSGLAIVAAEAGTAVAERRAGSLPIVR